MFFVWNEYVVSLLVKKIFIYKPRNMDTKLWGNPMWTTMFAVAMNFPETIDPKNSKHRQIVRRYRRFFHSIPYVLPCSYCRCSAVEVLTKVAKINFEGRRSLMASIYLWKSIVNEKLNAQDNRKRKSPPFEKVLAKYGAYSTEMRKKHKQKH